MQGQSHLPSPGHPRGSQDAHSPTDHQAFFVLSSQDIQAAIIGVWKECWPGKEERRIKRELPPALGTPKDAEWLHCRIPFSSLLQSESLQDLTFPGHLQHWSWQEITPTLVSPETPHSHPVPICQAGRCPACLKELLLSCLPLSFQGDFPQFLSMPVCVVESRAPQLCSQGPAPPHHHVPSASTRVRVR